MVLIIDYQMGNVGSVKNALDFLGVENKISNVLTDIKRATHLILPGVGSFGEGMKKLKKLGLIDTLKEEVVDNKKPFLGICLGMQLLAQNGEEGGLNSGLGWIDGRTKKFNINEKKFTIPHVGWDDIFINDKEESLFKGINSNVFYFAHSYIFEVKNSKNIAAFCEYGEKFCAVVKKDNILGTQFHPERSQKSGLKILENFLTAKLFS